MINYNKIAKIFFSIILFNVFSVTSFANSSWRWISETRPYDLLPIVIIITLAIETILIAKASGAHPAKVFTGVFIGNALSFILPYININYNTLPYSDIYSLYEIIERGTFYTVGILFLIITLIIEVPFMYLLLRKNTDNKNKLIKYIILSNVITTVIVAVIERIICNGQW